VYSQYAGNGNGIELDIIMISGAATIDRSSPIRNRSRSAEKLRHGTDHTPINVVSRYINTEYKSIRPYTGRKFT